MRTLEQIIEHSRELKRALAVKMSQRKVKHQNIADYLQVSALFISKWRLIPYCIQESMEVGNPLPTCHGSGKGFPLYLKANWYE